MLSFLILSGIGPHFKYFLFLTPGRFFKEKNSHFKALLKNETLEWISRRRDL